MGVCDLWASFHFDPLQVVGGGYPHFEWTFAGRPPEPSPGRAFTSKISQKRSEDIGTDFVPPPVISTYSVIPRKHGPGVTRSDLLVVNKPDLAGGHHEMLSRPITSLPQQSAGSAFGAQVTEVLLLLTNCFDPTESRQVLVTALVLATVQKDRLADLRLEEGVIGANGIVKSA